jgi:hypothetical protein
VHDDILESELDGLTLTFRVATDSDDPAVAMIDDSARAAVAAGARAEHARRDRPSRSQERSDGEPLLSKEGPPLEP